MELKKSKQLELLAEHGALIIQAHPFRDSSYIDHIRLYPRQIHGVEVYNSNRTDFENELAKQYAANYEKIPFAGSDNHRGPLQTKLGGMEGETPVQNEREFIEMVQKGSLKPFAISL